MKIKNVDMLSGSITKGLIALMIPIIIMNVMQTVFGIVDMIVLRFFANDTAVGAVGTSATYMGMFTALSTGLSAGANVVIAKRIGAGHRKSACRAVKTALLFALAAGLVLMGLTVVFAEQLLQLANCPAELFEQAVVYFRIYFLGFPLLMLYHFCAAVMRAAGDTRRPMYYLILAGFVKAIFTIVFVSFLGMTVDGVALATILSNLLALVLSYFTMKQNSAIRGDYRKARFEFKTLGEILYNGLPTGFQGVLYSLANLAIVAQVNNFGADAATGISIANNFDGIIYQICYAPSLAVTPYIAQNIGAHNLDRARKTLLRAILITGIFGIVFGSLSVSFSGQLSYLMSPSPAVISYSQQKMWLVSGTYFICGINDVIAGTFRGMGKPLLPMVSTLLFMCLLRFVWVYLVYPFLPQTIFWLYFVWPLGWSLSIFVLLGAYLPTVKKLQLRMDPQTA